MNRKQEIQKEGRRRAKPLVKPGQMLSNRCPQCDAGLYVRRDYSLECRRCGWEAA